MTEAPEGGSQDDHNLLQPPPSRAIGLKRRRSARQLASWGLAFLVVAVFVSVWLGTKASSISSNLRAATDLVPHLKTQVSGGDVQGASATVRDLGSRTASARQSADDPLWKAAGALPWFGDNFRAAREVAISADDVARLGAAPLVSALQSLDWKSWAPTADGIDLDVLQAARPKLAAAAHAVTQSAQRLNRIDAENLVPQVSRPLVMAQSELTSIQNGLTSVADAVSVAPELLGSKESRQYLLLMQNNAESRASGGIPGALAVLNFDNGKLTLGAQSTAGEVGVMTPVLPLDPVQEHIYSSRLGKYMQDVNLTPDFPTAASTAQGMWERRTGQRVDGVISIDPVALSYVLDATGPVTITDPQLVALASGKLPTGLNGENVVRTLLSDVYSNIQQPALQDAYFAGVAQEIFVALSEGKGEANSLINGISRGVQEGRVMIWSGLIAEQSLIAEYPVSGSIAGPSVAPAQFGVYFNDGTGAKMDYYVKRTVQLIKECASDGYVQTTVRITSMNTAPADAATSLPAYVTGDGAFGVSPGSVQTNIVAYGPVQSNVETVKLDGQKTQFAPYLHSNRPVGVIAIQLAPGESRSVDFTFGKIVQHSEPNIVVTPTVQDVKDVILPTESAACG